MDTNQQKETWSPKYLGLPRRKNLKVFHCFVAIVRVRVYYDECYRFLHQGWATNYLVLNCRGWAHWSNTHIGQGTTCSALLTGINGFVVVIAIQLWSKKIKVCTDLYLWVREHYISLKNGWVGNSGLQQEALLSFVSCKQLTLTCLIQEHMVEILTGRAQAEADPT